MTNAQEILRSVDRQILLAYANSLSAIAKAQVSAGKKPTAKEQEILDRATALLPSLDRK